jgi:serine/threonine-protein kinase
VHCDVTPDNVLCTPEGFAKLGDFGACARAGRTDRESLRGNLAYVAPERLRGGAFDRRADVFGLGVLLYELLAGAHPFSGHDETSTLARIVGPVPALPLRARVDVPPELDRLVSAALAKAPAARPATAAALASALERALPGCALRAADERVAAEVRRAAGARVEEHTRAVREALQALDAARTA